MDFDPHTVQPAHFFESFLPEQYEQVRDELTEGQKAVTMKVGFELHGDDGGSWTIEFADGDLLVGSGLEPDCNVVVRQPVDAWRQTLAGSGGLADANVDLANQNPAKIKPQIADRVRMIRGTIRFAVLDGDEQVWEVQVHFGPDAPAEPQAEVVLQEDDAALIRSGELQHQQAFMAGKIKITGDMNLAMQVGSLSMIQ